MATKGTCGTCKLLPSDASVPVAATGGAGTFNVTLTGGKRLWIPVPAASWITISSPTTAQENSGTVTYSCAAQAPGAPARSGKIAVAGKTYTVNQQAGA